MEGSVQGSTNHEAPARHGEFYLPLKDGEPAFCPNDRTHPVAVYSKPKKFAGEVADV